ncbi:outer membrane protein assembly factor [Silicimonas algicola]|uniref:Autotransporter secretion outer membrane protein TamA n=1 Tax=Silicimonas algicola TaxID=1826607 RepID=A0A316GCG5_9RHOB|nr:autotransporter assembly complex family protein [Silicimonas algicola]AZQ66000.1 outer membrane protein assembly factor [Silicimonas algicola]PWK58293.1 autotransporter secretion outer membrane protein TamA [Silicimonas algicola]
MTAKRVLGAVLALCTFSTGALGFEIRFQTPDTGDSLRDALYASSLTAAEKEEGTNDPQDILAAAQADYARLLGVLYDRGRYSGVISILLDGREAAAIPPLSAPRAVQEVTIRVEPGPVFRFGRAEIGPLAPGTEIPEEYRRGEVAGAAAIRAAAEAAVEAWRSNGNAKARVSDERIVARHAQTQLDASLRLTPGPVLSFGPVRVRGNDDTKTARILKIAGLEEGRRYDPEEIDRAVTRLRRTGTFSSVTVEEAEAIGPGNTLPLTIGVVEQTPRRFGFGAEYGSVEGGRLSAFWLHRNFLGGAERFRVDGEVSGITGETGGIDYSLGVRYERPATPKADIDLFAAFSFESLDEPDFTSDTTEFTLGFTRYATDELTVEAGLGYLYSEIVDDFGPETFSLITLPLAAEYDARDVPLNPTEGLYADLTVTPFLGLAGTTDGAQMTFDGRGYRALGGTIFAGRLQLGALAGPSLEDSPAIYRFYSGGGGTVRGQDYQSLGVDTGGAFTGGRSFVGLSAEARVNAGENFQVVPFVDWGYIGEESFADFSGESHAGAGLGVRYVTGIGPIRLDVATPIAGDTESANFQIYVGIGQAF